MAEWLKAVDCKSIGFSYVGSNPTFSNKYFLLKKCKKAYLYREIPVGKSACKGGTLQSLFSTKFPLKSYFYEEIYN